MSAFIATSRRPSVERRAIKYIYLACVVVLSHRAGAYPEFQKFSQTNSGMGVSCAMCHANPDGPEGTGPGQIGRLTPDQLKLLNEARAAFDPGKEVKSPILNPFGNHIIKEIGKKKVIELKRNPRELATALGATSDLDDDGVPDSREYLEGTHPLQKSSGNPWLLAAHNFKKHAFNVVMVVLAVVCLLYGFHYLHVALELKYARKQQDGEEADLAEDGDETEPARPDPLLRRRHFARTAGAVQSIRPAIQEVNVGK